MKKICNGRHHQYVFTNIVLIVFCYLSGANIDTLFETTNKILLFFFFPFIFLI